jgi:hypothetical protein
MIRIICNIVIAALALGSTSVLAQTINVGSDSGLPGATVVIPVNFVTGATDVGSMDIDVDFDATKFSDATGDCSVTNVGQALATCSKAAGKVRISIAGDGNNALITGLAANISFTIADPVAAGGVDLDGVIFAASNVDGSAELPAGTITVNDGVVTVLGPQFSSSPASFAFGPVVQGGAEPSQDLTITNTGPDGTALTGDCGFHGANGDSNPSDVFLLDGGTANVPFNINGQNNDTVAVSCDTSKPFGPYTGQFSCDHNGGAGGSSTPVTYALSCTITDVPHPAFTATPASLDFVAADAGDFIPTQDSAITNTGDNPSTLTTSSACTLMGTDAGQYSLTGTTSYALADGGGESAVVTVRCTSETEGVYNDAWVSCPHTDPVAGTGTIPLTCEVFAAGAAVYGSSPVPPGGVIDLTPGEDAIVGTDPPDQTNNIQNTAANVNSNDLWVECSLSANVAISETTDNNGFFIAPGSSRPATFACDASIVGNYNATYTCDYGVDGTASTGAGTATYDVDCDVRNPESVVSEDPESPDTLTTVVPTGGTGTFHVTFTEDADEGVDGELITCDLEDGSVFSITSPVSFPAVIPAGGSLGVTVEGTDPGGVDIIQDVLRCTYLDSGSEGTDVFYNLVMQIGEVATFTVFKDFTDENPNAAPVEISCDNGLPIRADSTVREGLPVTFVVGAFESGELNCEIFESPTPDGYMASFEASGDSAFGTTDTSCVFTTVDRGNENICRITNRPKPVDVVITKEWLIEGSSSDFINISYELTLYCDAVIVDGYPYLNGGTFAPASNSDSGVWYKPFGGIGPETFTAQVIPGYPSSDCLVVENVYDDTVETENNCGNLVVSAGHGDICTVSNTVFFEGIPTLSQYGLAILALLMLTVGMVGFRRFT